MQGGYSGVADAPGIITKGGPAPRGISFPLVPDPREGRLGPFLEQGDGIGRQLSGPTAVSRVDTSQDGFVIAIDQVDKALRVIRVGVSERKDINPATVPDDDRLGGRATRFSRLETVNDHPVIWWDAEEDGLSPARAEDEHIEQVGIKFMSLGKRHQSASASFFHDS